jgi:predicted ATPase
LACRRRENRVLERIVIEKPNFFVFTGGGGTGKTTLLRHLRRPANSS